MVNWSIGTVGVQLTHPRAVRSLDGGMRCITTNAQNLIVVARRWHRLNQ
jgi:hypothetical protein